MLVHKESKNYKVLIKALLRGACEPLSTEDVKEVENSAGTIRADKVKAEKAAAAAKSKSELADLETSCCNNRQCAGGGTWVAHVLAADSC